MSFKSLIRITLCSVFCVSVLTACGTKTQDDLSGELLSETEGQLDADTKANRYSSKEVLWVNSWDKDIFRSAAKENLLVLLSLEANWCHWCHVMKEKTYHNPEIVKYINEHFMAVRVDQDSNPYLSTRYKRYGWPATIVFDSQGRELAKRSGYIEAEKMLKLMRKLVDNPEPERDYDKAINYSISSSLNSSLRLKLHDNVINTADFSKGGLNIKQKYVDRETMEYVFSYQNSQANKKSKKKLYKYATKTLDSALKLLDPEWGGFYQYSTYREWDRPHYEKVLDVQAEYIRIYALAYAYTGKKEYRNAAIRTVEYLQDFLMSPDGAYYSSQDADLFAGEKANDYFNLSASKRRSLGIPKVDKHIYSDKNGKVIEALAMLYKATGEIAFLEKAMRAADALIHTRMSDDGSFIHSYEQDSYLEDNIYMARAMLSLYEVTTHREWLIHAKDTADYIIETFKDIKPGYTSISHESEEFSSLSKLKPRIYDNVKLGRFFNLLASYTGEEKYKDEAQYIMKYLGSEDVALSTITEPGILLLDQELAQDPLHITIVGSKRDSQAKKLFLKALSYPSTYARVEWYDSYEGRLMNHDVEYPGLDRAAAFTCANKTCSLPVFKAKELYDAISSR